MSIIDWANPPKDLGVISHLISSTRNTTSQQWLVTMTAFQPTTFLTPSLLSCQSLCFTIRRRPDILSRCQAKTWRCSLNVAADSPQSSATVPKDIEVELAEGVDAIIMQFMNEGNVGVVSRFATEFGTKYVTSSTSRPFFF